MGVRVIKTGLLTTIQDLGRSGFRKYGIAVSGAIDTLALRLGNSILGNNEDEAGIECTSLGPTLYFDEGQLVCITGADLSPSVDNMSVAMWKPVFIAAGSVLSFGKPKSGCRSYICFYRGLDVPEVLGSKSTYLKGRIGGWKGRALKKQDEIKFCRPYVGSKREFRWCIDTSIYPDLSERSIRVTEGPHFAQFDSPSLLNFLFNTFTLSNESDRMGYRLESEGPLRIKDQREQLSTAVSFGTIQVPPQGNAIILMADHPTTGGYPVIGQVATVDLPLLAQKTPQDQITFELIALTEAHGLLKNKNTQLNQLKRTIALKYE
ncbi:5-oxoprolinase subunit C family protein [Sphingobacterium lumbrici]|uniref:5-oxoprolinase subunit C family protein n=1 Tax=Sphingobacterium lumbrici TaxID=2559600 RepID=UPI0011284970|nr:biotin-dependent carboxyltransferase family protein [Sphingobacterium lumbrici]